MKTSSVAELLQSNITLQEVTLKGWVRTFRSNRFIALNDGSTIHNIQCVVDFEKTKEETLKRITTGAAVCISGTLVESQGKGQTVEIQVSSLQILGDSNPDEYPIQPKKHSLEFLLFTSIFKKMGLIMLIHLLLQGQMQKVLEKCLVFQILKQTKHL